MEDKIGCLKNFYYPSRCESYPRIGHRCIQIGHHILVFGGCNAQMDFNLPLLRINCETIHTDIIPTKNALKLQGFSLFSYKTHIYLWGGLTLTAQPTNALLTYTGEEFQVLPQHGPLPAPRHFHASTFFSQRYLLIYGGTAANQILYDWHLLDCSSMTWSPLQVHGHSPPHSLDNHLMWHAGRGFLLTGEGFDAISQQVVYQNLLYELKFSDLHKHQLRIEAINVTNNAHLSNPRGSPSAVLLNLDCPYVLLLGGERVVDRASLQPINDLWLFNLESLEWTAGRANLNLGFGFEAVHFQERVYLIGGVGSGSNSRQLANIIEVMDMNAHSIEAKVCQSCREMYGLKEYGEYNRQFSVKYEHEEKPKSFFSCGLVSRMAKFIKNPFSAIGLLVDNSFNLSSTYLTVNFLQFGPPSPSPADQLRLPSLPYNYIRICDNSYGFTHDEILECMHSFSVKTERLTSDRKYEEELEIRKEYGVNVKLGGLRLGCSCLFITRTEDNFLFVCYFSCLQEDAPFTLHYYFRTPEGEITSPATRHLIKQDLSNFLPEDYETLPALPTPNPAATTAIYLLHLRDGLRKDPLPIDSSNIFFDHTLSHFFRSLRLYLQALYLKPFVGRVIALEGEPIKYKQLATFFRKEESDGRATRVETDSSLFSQAELYRPNNSNYHFKEVLVYQLNRLVCSLNSRSWDLFGYVEIPPTIPLDICKTKLENPLDELRLNNYLKTLSASTKRTYPSPYDPQPQPRRKI